MNAYELDGKEFFRLISGGYACLRENADIVNDLNVFPIPDGDTGANMLLTIEGGINNLRNNQEDSIGKASTLLADGMLLGARGNSGVILSQIFAGIAKALDGKDLASAKDMALAMQSGVQTGYNAVVNPTEGTILTVAREAADYAESKVNGSSTIEDFFKSYLKEAEKSLQRTPDLLPVLKEAGVVDSGGAGLYYIINGILKVLMGEEAQQFEVSFNASSAGSDDIDYSKFNEDSVMKYGYCTEFLLQLQKCKCDIDAFSIDELIAYLESIGGDSIVAFKNGSVVKVHVHTMTPYKALEYAQRYGEYLKVKIENMTLQHSDAVVQNRFRIEKPSEERKKFAMVVVATGEGIMNTFKELGADYVIQGGQGKNPCSEDFITAFDAVNADDIFVLPNNGNIVLAAKQAAGLYDSSRVHVIESKNIGEGYAAMTMLCYDSGDAESIKAELLDAMQGVTTGMVSTSVRDANLNGIAISMHDYIGFTNKTMLAADKDKVKCAFTLLKNLKIKEHEFLIAIYGQSATEQDRQAFKAGMAEKYPSIELYEIDGGQEVYDFMLILQ